MTAAREGPERQHAILAWSQPAHSQAATRHPSVPLRAGNAGALTPATPRLPLSLGSEGSSSRVETQLQSPRSRTPQCWHARGLSGVQTSILPAAPPHLSSGGLVPGRLLMG